MEQESCVTCDKEVIVSEGKEPAVWLIGELTLGEGEDAEDIKLYACSKKCADAFWEKAK